LHYYIEKIPPTKKRKISLTENITSSMQNNMPMLISLIIMDIIKIIRTKFSSFQKEIIISEIQISHPQLIFFWRYKKRDLPNFLKP